MSTKKYEIVYCDPPWRFKSKRTGGNMNAGAGQKYNTMTIDQLKKLDLPSITKHDCVLVMWWVGSQPQEALDLCRAWGFTVKNINGFVWNKLTENGLPFFGMGYYTRAGSESAMIAIKGKPKVLSHSVRAVMSAVNRSHSEKPAQFRTEIETLFGKLPRLEMFARVSSDGWDVFGDEVENSIKITLNNYK